MKRFLFALRFSPSKLLFFCFCAASLAGSIWINGTSQELQKEIGVLGQAWMQQSGYKIETDPSLALPVICMRCFQAAVLWLAGMTAFGMAGMCLAVFLAGFSMAVIVSALTMEIGLSALPLFVLSLFPHWLFYGPVFAVLCRWGVSREKKNHGTAFLILLTATAAGALAEVFLSPGWVELVGTLIRTAAG